MRAGSITVARGVVVLVFAVGCTIMLGRTLVIRPSAPSATATGSIGGEDGPAPPHADIATRMKSASAATGATVFGRCAACHSVGRDGPDLDGPNLYGVVGAPIAQRRRRFAYTAALRQVGGSWDVTRLDAWLTYPKGFAPGTSMSFPGLPDPGERADVIAFLAAQGSNLPAR